MTPAPSEQRNLYKGSPARPWVKLRLTAPDGSTHELELLVDTGNPFAVVIGQTTLARLSFFDVEAIDSNFGLLHGAWLQVSIPPFGSNFFVIGYANDEVVSGTKATSPDFEGLIGLPLLRLMEYGGDADWFWLRPAPTRGGQP